MYNIHIDNHLTIEIIIEDTMSKSITHLTLFVGSPCDVKEERNALESLVTELNRNVAHRLGFHLDLIKWETDISPGFGTDPQDVINSQIPNYDIFIGIFWGRIGTPTKRSESGSIEEFQQALQRSTKEKVEILLYFKQQPIHPKDIDPEQFSKLKSFKASLPEQGGLYKEFSDTDDFVNTLRADLSSISARWKTDTKSTASDNTREINDTPDSSDEDIGYIDYLEIFQSSNEKLGQAYTTISDATAHIGTVANKATKSLTLLEKSPENSLKAGKSIINSVAHEMKLYSSILQDNVKDIRIHRSDLFNALSNSLTFYDDMEMKQESLEDLKLELNSLISSARNTAKNLEKYRNTTMSLPRMTTEINRAKKLVAKSLDNILEEINITCRTALNIIDALKEFKK